MKYLVRVVTIIFIVTALISAIYILKNANEDKKQSDIFQELEDIVTEESKDKNEERKDDNVNLQQLYKVNNDFAGWIKIEDTNISYPVMQTNNSRKDYYLRKNFYKQYSQLGTPYIAEYCNIQTSDNLIIYGHHISNNKMFGELEKYKNEKFYRNHKIINFDTLYGKSEYKIIAVFKTVAYTGFEYYKFEKANTKREFDTFIEKCKELSFYDTEETAEYGDKLITLSTCEYSNKNGRLVVVAKKMTTE